MITRMTHMNIYVLDQDSALDFYINKLGLKVIIDAPMNKEVRWLTVGTTEQPGFEINLTPVHESILHSKDTAEALRDLIKKGTFGVGIFTCTDIMATYEELKAKGVEFIKPPTKEFYGTEALFKDDSGNWFSLAQLTPVTV
ncbi:VOC family protein [Mucilaginibacter corticis]|uniref:VOC family protein n=2 Tax=Mucilaginibacter corticis TaxID=2597670 RepID=A0A556MT87_9SPHI|nr:VOC family protein [Mucilaginibacter corticis]